MGVVSGAVPAQLRYPRRKIIVVSWLPKVRFEDERNGVACLLVDGVRQLDTFSGSHSQLPRSPVCGCGAWSAKRWVDSPWSSNAAGYRSLRSQRLRNSRASARLDL